MVPDRANLLIVEDEREIVTIYEDWLQNKYTVRTASDGKEALAEISPDIDVVLLDRNLPKLSGEEVLEAIRNRDLPCRVVIVSAVEPDFDLIRMEFDGYLVKPVSKEELLTTVQQTITRSSYDEKLQEFYILWQKRTLLENQKPEDELQASEEYTELEEQLESVTAQLDSIAETVEKTNGVSSLSDNSNKTDSGDPP